LIFLAGTNDGRRDSRCRGEEEKGTLRDLGAEGCGEGT